MISEAEAVAGATTTRARATAMLLTGVSSARILRDLT
jgi:hypothetical protein